MSTNDWIWLGIALLIILLALYGISRLTRESTLTKEEYERRLRKSSGIASNAMNAAMYAIQEWMHPKAVEAIAVQKDMRQGFYNIEQESGKGSDDEDKPEQ